MSRRVRVLVVDDSVIARRLIAMRLAAARASGELELDIDEAGDGESALECYAAAPFDLVLLDLTMPGIGGYETLKELRARDPDARVVVITADIQDAARDRVLEAGGRAFVAKPIGTDQLAELVRAHAR